MRLKIFASNSRRLHSAQPGPTIAGFLNSRSSHAVAQRSFPINHRRKWEEHRPSDENDGTRPCVLAREGGALADDPAGSAGRASRRYPLRGQRQISRGTLDLHASHSTPPSQRSQALDWFIYEFDRPVSARFLKFSLLDKFPDDGDTWTLNRLEFDTLRAGRLVPPL